MKKIVFILLVALIQACAFTDATLNVSHNSTKEFKGPIGDVESFSFKQEALVDQREDKERIGWKKNGYGQNTADIFTSQPVETIVANAVTDGLKKNGHTLSETPTIAISGTVDKFWFESDINFWTIEFTGDVQCTLVFTDVDSGKVIYESTYSGSYSEKKGGGLSKTWEIILGKAIDNLIDDIIFDEDLVEALEDL